MIDALARLVGLLEPLTNVDLRWALVALALQLANLVCRSLAWRNVLAAAFPDQQLGTYRVGRAYAIGCALNGYLPARGGDAVKVGLVRMQHPETNTVAVASSCSVVLLFDTVVGISLLTIGWRTGALPAAPPLPLVDRIAGAPALAVLVALVAVVGLALLARRAAPAVRRAWSQLAQGVAVLRAPGRYVRTVLAVQALAWTCRIGVVFCMLHAFGIEASVPLAALVVVVGGVSTMVPVPGGAGTQQALAVFVLSGIATAGTAFGYSVGTQVGVTVVNTTIGAIAAMLLFRRLHPLRALRDAAAAAAAQAPHVEPLPDPAT